MDVVSHRNEGEKMERNERKNKKRKKSLKTERRGREDEGSDCSFGFHRKL